MRAGVTHHTHRGRQACDARTTDQAEKGVTQMRRFSKAVVQSRAGLILGSAVMTTLLLPVTAFAGGFAAPRGVHHRAAGGGGSTELVIFLGIIAVAFLSVLIVSRIAT